MTALYSEAGHADGYVGMLVDQPEAYDLLQAGIAYRRDDIDKVFDMRDIFFHLVRNFMQFSVSVRQ